MDSRRHQGGRRFDNGGRRFRRGGGRGSGPMWFKGEGYNDHESVCIAEEVAGISGFLTPAQRGFKGVVKQRFADFVVHELSQRTKQPITLQNVAKKGKTAQLAFQERVLDFVLGVVTPRDEINKSEEMQDKEELIGSVRQLARKLQQTSTKQQKLVQVAQEAYHLKQLVILVTQEIGAKKGKEFEQFLEKVELARVEFEAKAKEVGEQAATNAALAAADGLSFYLGGLNEKADRVFIHETMRRYGKSRIVADTLNIGSDTAVIRVRPHFAVKLLPGERDSRRDWPVGQPDYLQLTLYKRNKDTSAVTNQLASVLKISPALFSFADVKDKRGITTQLCTVYRVPKDRAQVAFRPGGTKKLEDQQYLVGDLRYVSRKLELGDCAGNRIAMVIRSLPTDEKELPDKELRQTVRSWERRGFINFYGLHRFGNASTSYHLLGRAMLRKDYKLAVLLLLRPQEGEASKIRAAREHFRKHKDVAAALRMLPPFLVPERAVLEGHQQHGIDAHELAFNNIPKPLRVSYIETYQNFVWNEMASMRVAKFSSTSAVVGDLVLVRNVNSKVVKTSSESAEPARKRMRTGKTTRRQVMQEVMELTEANASQYSIEDVVLPLPGHASVLPMLTTDGIDLNAHFGPDGSQLYVLDGSYRHLVKKPTRVSFQLERYADPTKPLISNDVDALLANSPDTSSPQNTEESSSKQESEQESHRALILEFDLDYGCDATIAIRELMKQSSSAHVNWQTPNVDAPGSEAAKSGSGSTAADSASSGSRAGQAKKADTRKVIKAQKKTQVAIGRPGFSL
ncbi:tRNA pseudouridine synthase D (TruD), partial [Phytophthora infestans]